MVCPMVVLVGFSVVIATFGIFMYNEHTKTNDNNKKVQDQEQRRVHRRCKVYGAYLMVNFCIKKASCSK